MANKIKYGLKNVHYAVATIDEMGAATYETPVPWPGAVSLSLSAEGDTSKFYADDIAYYTSVANNGYSGDYESAMIPESFRTDVLGEESDSKQVLVEKAATEPVHFALLFEFAGDAKKIRHVLYNCVASRPDVSGNTKEESIDPATESISITATSIYCEALDADIVKARTSETTDPTAYAGWYTAVYEPSAVE